MGLNKKCKLLFLVLAILAIICVIAWWAMHDRQHEAPLSTGNWKYSVPNELIVGDSKNRIKGSDARPLREILEKQPPLAALLETDPNDNEAVSLVQRDLAEFRSWGQVAVDGLERYKWDKYFSVGCGFLRYRVAILADDCPQTERTQYCDTLLHLLRLRNSARGDQAMDDFLMTYLTADWYFACRTFDVPNDELESKFMELGWFRFLRTGTLPDGWTMRHVSDGTNSPH